MKHIRCLASGAVLLLSTGHAVHAAPARKTQPPASCSAGLNGELDRESFDGHGFSSTRLATFGKAAERAFKQTADALCRSGKIRPAALRPYRRLIVQSGSGAVDAAVYTDPERFGRTGIVFQWVFNEEGLALPDAHDIAQGITCWASPAASICAGREP